MHRDVGFDSGSPGSCPGPKAGAKPLRHPGIPVSSIFNFFLKNFFYECHRERGRDTGRGRSRLHAPGARCGIRSQVSRIVPWAKDRHQTTSPPRDPLFLTYREPPHCFPQWLYLFACHQECKGATLSPKPHQHLLLLVLLILAIMTALR